MKKVDKLCKNCPFYSGVKCHGHGDFWGNCNLLKLILKTNDNNKFIGSLTFNAVVFDDSICIFQKAKFVEFYELGD